MSRFHRLDGPAYVETHTATLKDAEYLSKLKNPYLIDDWLRTHTTHLIWFVDDLMLAKRFEKLTDLFPKIDLEYIYSKISDISAYPDCVLRWIWAARCLGLSDEGLVRLEESVKVLEGL